MKQDNFLFVDVVSSIFLLVLLLCNLFGLLYLTDGNFLLSGLISLFIVVCYYTLIQALKRNKERMVNKQYKDAAVAFLGLYFCFGLLSLVLMIHVFNIESNVKSAVQEEAKSRVNHIQSLGPLYQERAIESIQTFEAELKDKLGAYKATRSPVLRQVLMSAPYRIPESILNSPSASIDVVASTKIILDVYALGIEKNKQDLDSLILKPVLNYAVVFEKWDRLNLMKAYTNLADLNTVAESKLNEYVSKLPILNAANEFEPFNNLLPLNSPFQLARQFTPNFWWPFLVTVLMHLFILIPFFTYRVRRYVNYQSDNEVGEVKNNGGTIEL